MKLRRPASAFVFLFIIVLASLFVGGETSHTPDVYAADSDGDGVDDSIDNCPSVSNASQSNLDGDAAGDACEAAHCVSVPNWWTSPGAATDPDCDGFTTTIESDPDIGTNPNDACAETATTNDEVDDRWPADFNDNQLVNTLDLTVYASAINTASGQAGYVARADLNQNDVINTLDLVLYASALNHTCATQPCGGPGGPGLPGDPGGSGSPTTDAYSLGAYLPASYLGAGASPTIEFVLMPGHPNVGIVVNQDGFMYRVALDQSAAPTLWGNLSTVVQYGGEEGLLSMQFSPDFEDDCRVYVYYSTSGPDETQLARLTATPTDLNEASREVVLHVEDFASNHNGGSIAFDSNGLLYLSTGDGGGADDPQDTGQDINRLLGKVLRIDVSGATGYTVPPTNPYVGVTGRDEIYAIGFRNPFRMTIDPPTDQVWLGDVGQGQREEVDLVTLGGNYGWDCREGDIAHSTAVNCTGLTFVAPRAVYSHTLGRAVSGGVIYRGDNMPELYGWYIYGDFYTGRVWAVDTTAPGAAVQLMDLPDDAQNPTGIAAFTLGADGEVYLVDYSDGIYRITR